MNKLGRQRMVALTARPRQRGVALLIILGVLVMGLLYVFLLGLNSTGSQQARDKITMDALAQAKEALIAYAVTYSDTHSSDVPGYLPCPDNPTYGSSEGNAGSNCSGKNISVIGKLPWKTLGLEPLRDGYGECLWYAVSGSHKNNTSTDMMNWDTNGQLEVMSADNALLLAGITPDSRAVAVIFAPGPSLAGQNRAPSPGTPVCGGNYTAANYLDSANGIDNATISSVAGALSRFISGAIVSTVNDRLAYIAPRDIFDAVQRRSDFQANLNALTQRVASCIATYGNNNTVPGDRRVPGAAPITLTNFLTNASYSDNAPSAPLLSGRVPYKVSYSVSVPIKNNSLSSPYNLLTNAYCPSWGTFEDAWYRNWKDHLFYAVASSYSATATTPTTCGNCLQVNGTGQYAGIVIFAGRKLANQSRDTDTQKGNIGNYLEGRNYSNHPNSAGNSNYEKSLISTTFNDTLYCVDNGTNLSANPCL